MTKKELKSVLDYNPEAGVFVWRTSNGTRKVGDIAGHIRKDGYVDIQTRGKKYSAHRLAWLFVHGEMPSEQIDHINHNRSDNRIENLRAVTNQENTKNKSKNKNNKSGVTGVNLCKKSNKWKAQIKINKKCIFLGQFTEFSEAVSARKNAEVLYKFHENHGRKGNK